MRPAWIPLVLLAAVSACGDGTQEPARVNIAEDAINPPGVAISTCGIVDGYVAPEAERPGSLAIDGRAWEVNPDAEVQSDHLLVRGEDVCVSAELDPTLRIERFIASLPGVGF
jgi:hypothetical protein